MLNLSLSGCGFLAIYHIGVISAFREHAPEVIQDKIAGCSGGALAAACALCDCCLGQLVADTLEIALKARSRALGPLHPSFSIVDILRNGLRRILPVDAHKICSGRLYVSLTRWKDGKNFIVSEFDSREELIQCLICSSFVPFYSGLVPPKFRGTYYWDGGLSNNQPIIDQDTIIVSPFGGESDICPREETASYYCLDFQGTNLHWSTENIYRLARALFPPSPEILKAICFRGYKDGIGFLKSRNLLQCSCYKSFREKTSISSVFGDDLRNLALFENANDVTMSGGGGDVLPTYDSSYSSDDEENIYAEYNNEPPNYQEMPLPVCEVLDAACNASIKQGLVDNILDSDVARLVSIVFLPWTLPVEMTLNFTKKCIEMLPKIKVPSDSSNLIDVFLVYVNHFIQKLTYDKFQYHARVTCQLCVKVGRSSSHQQFNICHHNKDNVIGSSEDNNNASRDIDRLFHVPYDVYYPKFCARHRGVPSVCSSETTTTRYSGRRHNRKNKSSSYRGGGGESTSSVDTTEYRSTSSKYKYTKRLRYANNSSSKKLQPMNGSNSILKSTTQLYTATIQENTSSSKLLVESSAEANAAEYHHHTHHQHHHHNSVHFDLHFEDSAAETTSDKVVAPPPPPSSPPIVRSISEDSQKPPTTKHFPPNRSSSLNNNLFKATFATNDTTARFYCKSLTNLREYYMCSEGVPAIHVNNVAVLDNYLQQNKVTSADMTTDLNLSDDEDKQQEDVILTEQSKDNVAPLSYADDLKGKSEWDTYWDNLELNILGKINQN